MGGELERISSFECCSVWTLRVCTRDRYLDLGGNQLSGSFPSVIMGLSSLQ